VTFDNIVGSRWILWDQVVQFQRKLWFCISLKVVLTFYSSFPNPHWCLNIQQLVIDDSECLFQLNVRFWNTIKNKI
jgi:hypothetical protein